MEAFHIKLYTPKAIALIRETKVAMKRILGSYYILWVLRYYSSNNNSLSIEHKLKIEHDWMRCHNTDILALQKL